MRFVRSIKVVTLVGLCAGQAFAMNLSSALKHGHEDEDAEQLNRLEKAKHARSFLVNPESLVSHLYDDFSDTHFDGLALDCQSHIGEFSSCAQGIALGKIDVVKGWLFGLNSSNLPAHKKQYFKNAAYCAALENQVDAEVQGDKEAAEKYAAIAQLFLPENPQHQGPFANAVLRHALRRGQDAFGAFAKIVARFQHFLRDENLAKALSHAASNGRHEIVALMINNPQSLEKLLAYTGYDDLSSTFNSAASSWGRLEVVALMINNQEILAKLLAYSGYYDLKKAFFLAVLCGRLEVVALMINNQEILAKLLAYSGCDGLASAFSVAASKGHHEIVALMINNQHILAYLLRARENYGRIISSAFSSAARNGHHKVGDVMVRNQQVLAALLAIGLRGCA